MKIKRENVLICDSCFHRLDCDDPPHQVDFCVFYKKDTEVKSFENQNPDIQKTIEYSIEDLKSLLKQSNDLPE